ncbi:MULTISPECIES: extensin [unclassified Burkholderia]|uniref:extensin n=1 Tax=unclassified Burkholderia TaxID=2613784 RepID=UPI000F55A89F|nr:MULTISPECIES: extensin [unclassified Burkholderia]RQR75146.1 extensin [Burkholderia sp. Bp9011]RQR86174.1 extensin [Burkholderia sp. Bp9010]RQS00957.1 extensin [Burkholderia sp. Bp8991]RQS50149.1 extensin [Burkholderia sp. Bp8986]RQS67585.1 extensin [Burkholderia sp. Bp8977]
MTRTRKTLMIAGGLLVAAAGSGYVMLLRADHRAIAEAGIGDAAAPATAVTAANDGHTAQGTIAPPAPVAVPSAHVDQAVPQPAAVAPPAAAAARTNAAPASAAVAPVIAAPAKPAKPAKPSAPPPTVHVVTVEPEDATPSKAKPAQPVQAPVQAAQSAQPAQSTQSAPPAQAAQAARPSQQAAYQPPQHAARKRDGLERHAAAPSARKSETPETAALVRESAKLDPSLPAPQYVATPSGDRQHTSAGANSVAAAMTDQLVRQSSNIKAPAPANAGPGATQ